jgi:hypothetical protein
VQCTWEGCEKRATKQIGLPWDPGMHFYCDEHAEGPWPNEDFLVEDLPPGFDEDVPDYPPAG